MALKQQMNLTLLKNAITDILTVEINTYELSENDTDDIPQCLLLFQNFANYFRSKLDQYEHKTLETYVEPSRAKVDLAVVLVTDEHTEHFDDCLGFEITGKVGEEEDKSIEDEIKSENEVREGSLELQSELENQSLQIQKTDSVIENDLNSFMLRVKDATEKRAVSWKCIKCEFTAKFKGNCITQLCCITVAIVNMKQKQVVD